MTQKDALAIMESGGSVLLTGAAGTGKTYVLNQFIRRARNKGKLVAVTATTGLAATHLNGTTIHAWSGIGIHDQLPRRFVDRLAKSRIEQIKKADVLVIDEISMLHDFRLDMVEQITRAVRGGLEPFGGLQVILCGDFFQLPPVNRGESAQGSFVVKSQVWQQDMFTVCYLTKQYRQKDDSSYTDILNGIRAGFLTGRQLAALRERTRNISDPWEATTRLMTTNIDVDGINSEAIAQLEGESVFYDMATTGRKEYLDNFKKSCLAPEVLELKIGAHVMCIKNSQERKYVNGSLGMVEAFDPLTKYPIIRLLNGRTVTVKPDTWQLTDGDKIRASISQLPLRLAWAITVHKSQGMTLDAARIDLSNAFVEGMGYVALSRVKSLQSLSLDGLNGMALRVSPLAKEIDAELQSRSDNAQREYADTIRQWYEQEAKQPEDAPPVPIKTGRSWADKLAAMRQEYPNAYKPWAESDDQKLVSEFSAGKSIDDLSKLLGRHKGSIRQRLEKHLGADIFAQ